MLLLLVTRGLKVASQRLADPHPAAASKFKQDTKLACLQNRQPKSAPRKSQAVVPWRAGVSGVSESFKFLGRLALLAFVRFLGSLDETLSEAGMAARGAPSCSASPHQLRKPSHPKSDQLVCQILTNSSESHICTCCCWNLLAPTSVSWGPCIP